MATHPVSVVQAKKGAKHWNSQSSSWVAPVGLVQQKLGVILQSINVTRHFNPAASYEGVGQPWVLIEELRLCKLPWEVLIRHETRQ